MSRWYVSGDTATLPTPETAPHVFDDGWQDDSWTATLRKKLERDGLPPLEGDWYHLSPHKLPVGTRLVPNGGDTVWGEFYDHDRTMRDRRQRWVWMEHHPQPVRDWHTEMRHFAPKVYVYRIRPTKQPLPWNGNGAGGWVAPEAVIEEELAGPPSLPTRNHKDEL